MKKRRVVVVGGGISGLTVAHALAGSGAPLDITLVEASARLGGNIVTLEQAGFMLDGGPDSWVNAKPQASELARRLKLADEMIPTEPAARRVYVAQGGRLLPMPDGLVLGVPTKLAPMIATPLFSWDAKLRMALEPLIPSRQAESDESIAEFFSRRLGEEVTDKLVGPMLGGIYAGDAWELSIRATFPQFVESEKTYGSLVRAMRAQKKHVANGETPPSAFTSLKGGMARLVEALAAEIEPVAKIVLGAPVVALARDDSNWVVALGNGSIVADDVVFAGPTHILGEATRAFDPKLSALLAELRYTSTATVFFALRREDVTHPLDGTGFIVPRSERRAVLAATWASSKWAHRAPPEHVLLRVFFGGAGRESIVDLGDRELVDLASRELQILMNLSPRPVFTHVFRFHRASPQPTLGHLDRLARIRAQLAGHAGLYAAGSGLAIGIPDCIRLANETAKEVLARPVK